MAEYEKYLQGLPPYPDEKAAIVDLAKEIRILRKILWLSHGHTGMYGDDGEMQCSECTAEYGFYDWKRTPIEEIQEKMEMANLEKLAKYFASKGGDKNE